MNEQEPAPVHKDVDELTHEEKIAICRVVERIDCQSAKHAHRARKWLTEVAD